MRKLFLILIAAAILFNPSIGQQTAKDMLNKGENSFNQNKYDDAAKYFDQAIELDPNYAEAWNDKGWILLQQGKYDEALKNFNRSLELNANNTIAWNNKGFTFYAQGRYSEAIEAYEKAIEISPDFASCTKVINITM